LKELGDMMGPLVIGGCRIPTRIDKQETVHPNDLSFQKETAFWESKNGFLVEWSAIRKRSKIGLPN